MYVLSLLFGAGIRRVYDRLDVRGEIPSLGRRESPCLAVVRAVGWHELAAGRTGRCER